jgi:septin family protein
LNLEYFEEKSKAEKEGSDYVEDKRIHLCLYFLLGSKKFVDYQIMKELSKYVNIIPVLGKV